MGRRIRLGCLGAVVFAAVAFATGCGGGGGNAVQTAAQLRAQEIQVQTFRRAQPGMDPDQMDRSSLDLNDTVRTLSPGRYEVTVQNFSNVGFINSFWFHSESVKITRVLGSSSGTCILQSDNTISCSGMKLRPPKCTCQSGGIMNFRFAGEAQAVPAKFQTGHPATQGIDGGIAVHEMTPVPYHIPSYLNSQQNVLDLPLCARGQANTTAHPCVHGN